jgi:hypothetical protein
MTCFWDGLIAGLGQSRITEILNIDSEPAKFIETLKNKNGMTYNVLWNGQKISDKEQYENMTAIKNINIDNIYNGYTCSSSDPFLFLISQIFNVNINFSFNKIPIYYTNVTNYQVVKTI